MEVRRQQKSYQCKKNNTSRGVLFAVRINNKNEMIAAKEDQGNASKSTKKSASMMPICYLATYLRK
jgi:hypothetical protein